MHITSMKSLLLLLVFLLFETLPAFGATLIVRRWHGNWWKHRWIRLVIWVFPVAGISSVGLIIVARMTGADSAVIPLGLLVFSLAMAQIAGLAALSVSTFLMQKPLGTHAKPIQDNQVESPRRRRFLQAVAASLPVAAVGTSLAGVANTAGSTRVEKRTLTFPGLPAGLCGLRLLHLTDIHLGGHMTLDKLDKTLTAAGRLQPHLVVVTGDIADDLRLLPAALEMIAGLGAPLGVFATLGNHEYGVGVSEVRKILGSSPVRLLFNEGTDLVWAGERFHLAGIDDSAGGLIRNHRLSYLEESVAASLAGRDGQLFTILLSHRSDAFDFAAQRGVDLTLAGHTHGGQLGLAGKSALSLTRLIRYPWGLYQIGKCRLYTSSGAGEWLPFRLGCPSEAPVFELTSGPVGDASVV
ncbi:MAG: metallophosphoesterase [Candidatus Krumholzibacteriota bacterium]